jgi:hypothetical protein
VLYDPVDRLYLKIEAPKSQHRGGSFTQHIRVLGELEVGFCEQILAALPASSRLYPFSDSTFRKRWDAILARLGVPLRMGFTPASLRAGGTVHAYNTGTAVADLLWRLRLQHQKTLNHYLQEVATATSLREIDTNARLVIADAAALFQPLLHALRELRLQAPPTR